MKKIFSLISILLVCLFVTGCGGKSSGTITCIGEAHGENPNITTHEKYVVENNKIVEFTYYNILKYDDSYLVDISLDDLSEIYLNDDSYSDVEKVDNNTLKVVKRDPKNVYENIKTDNMIESIRSSMEDNEFTLYKYTCEIE